MDKSELRKVIRKEKIKARNELGAEERLKLSKIISDNVLSLPVFKAATNIMIYRAVKGEVSLKFLEENAYGKNLFYPLCISDTEMIALHPEGESAWHPGFKDIPEPVRELSKEIDPSKLDLIICPLSAFDNECNRMGMGAGFYDRFLPKCKNAKIIGVAFEVQREESLPIDPWDKPMDAVITEGRLYKKNL